MAGSSILPGATNQRVVVTYFAFTTVLNGKLLEAYSLLSHFRLQELLFREIKDDLEIVIIEARKTVQSDLCLCVPKSLLYRFTI